MNKQELNEALLECLNLEKTTEEDSLLQGNRYKYTMLHRVADTGNENLAERLINLGSEINTQNHEGDTPLMLALKNGYKKVVKVLLKAGADICIPNFQGHSPLGIVFDEFEEVSEDIRQLVLESATTESLRKSSCIKTAAFYRSCPVYCYELLKNYNLTKILLEMGNPVNAETSNGRTALHEAVKHLDENVVELLLKYGADVNATDYLGQKPLALIPSYNKVGEKTLKIVKILVDAGTKLIDDDGTDKLIRSILTRGSSHIIKLVLQFNPDLFVKTKSQKSPIDYLLKNKNPGVLDELVNSRIDLNSSSSNGYTLLHRAAVRGNARLVQQLLARGVMVNVKDCVNWSPLYVAVHPWANFQYGDTEEDWLRRIDCIRILLENDADPQIFTKDIDYQHIQSFDNPKYKNTVVVLLEQVFIHLALREASGQTIDQYMLFEVLQRPEWKLVYDSNKQQLEEMKKIKIDKSVSLFDFLIVKKVSLYVNNEKLILNLIDLLKECNIDSYYYRRLRQRILQLTRLIAVLEVFVELYKVQMIDIAEKIVNYVHIIENTVNE